jgi:sec-independent protein translocase protein TatB
VFGIDSEKLVILGLIAAVVLGPKRLPEYAKKLAEWIRSFRAFADNAQAKLSEEIGEDVDWRKLDPRQYDPRRIIREALLEEPVRGHSAAVEAAAKQDAANVVPGAVLTNAAASAPRERSVLAVGEAAPFDHEAT